MKKTPLELALQDYKNLCEGEVVWGKFGDKSKQGYIPPAPSKSASTGKYFDKWHDMNVSQNDGQSLTFEDAYTHYSRHSYYHGNEPDSVQKFRNNMADKGYALQRIAGRARYIGIGLKKN